MSRTDKDIPFFVKKLHDFEDGNIVHDHVPYKDKVRRYVNKDSIKEFKPDEKHKIADYANELRSLGKEPQIVETERHRGFGFDNEIYFSLMRHRNGRNLYSDEIYKDDYKKIVEVFYYDYVEIENMFSDECTDAENYNLHNNTDKRDGKRVSCGPQYSYKHFHKCYKNETSRSKVRQALRKVEKNLDNIDEYGSVAELTEYYGKKTYSC